MRVQRTLLVDSRARSVGSSQDFIVRLNQPIFNVVRTDLRQIIISEGVYNVFERNNGFLLRVTQKVDGVWGPENVVGAYVPTGYYTLKQFELAVQDACNVALSEINSGLGVTCAVNGSKQLEIYTDDDLVKVRLDFTNSYSASCFGFQYGTITEPMFTDDEYGQYWTIVSPLPVGLETIEYLAIQSAELGNRVVTTSGVSAYDVIPIADRVRPLVYERYSSKANDDTYSRKAHTLYQIDIRIIKPNGELVDLRGNEIAIVLEVITEDEKSDY